MKTLSVQGERLRMAARWIERAAIHCDEPGSVVYYANLARSLIGDACTEQPPTPFVKGLRQSGALLWCESCNHLLFDGREDLSLDVLGEGPHGPPVGLE